MTDKTTLVKQPVIDVRSLKHYKSVTVTEYHPKTITAQYFIEKPLYAKHVKAEVFSALYRGKSVASLMDLMSRVASVVRVGNNIIKCRYDLGHMLDVYHEHNEAENALDAAIFGEAQLDTQTDSSAPKVVTKSDYLETLYNITQRKHAFTSMAYGNTDIDTLTNLLDSLPAQSEGMYLMSDVGKLLVSLTSKSLVDGADYVLDCLIAELEIKAVKLPPAFIKTVDEL
ncbi:MAG: hypothetical protein GY833_12910 [Aestuariibacter sp.]|nr:hypothetical protein [Aestuariibacter sp.]